MHHICKQNSDNLPVGVGVVVGSAVIAKVVGGTGIKYTAIIRKDIYQLQMHKRVRIRTFLY